MLEMNEALEAKVRERTIELQNANELLVAQREVMKRLLAMHDRDYQLVGYEIHDGLVQDMTAAKMYLEKGGDVLKESGGKPARNYEQGIELLGNSIQEGRRLINGLLPPVLDDMGFVDAIANHLEEIKREHNIEYEFDRQVNFDRLAPTVERSMYRIVHEALNNMVRHSGSSKVFVSIHQENQHVKIIVRDWGCGFDSNLVKHKRFGLVSIVKRSELFGGTASITSQPGEGTMIEVLLPIQDVLLPGDIVPA